MMEISKTVDKNYGVSKTNENSLKDNEFYIPSLWRVFFARLTDLFISSIPFLIVGFVLRNQANDGDWINLFVIFTSALIWNFSYFVLLTHFLKGKTVGKIIFKIKLVKFNINEKIKFIDILKRELWFILMPWCFLYLGNILFLLLMSKYNKTENATYFNVGYIVYQINYWIFLVWNLAIGVSIRLQKNHQSGVDMKSKIYVVSEKPKKVVLSKPKTSKLVLEQTPGKFEQEILNEIGNSDEKEFYESINVDKPSLTENLKLENKNKKQIEQKEREKNE
ncbi:RDD family protein [Mesoplasma chauliocola]|uniref:RDD family protein n=1 Tax=Mesoplasma chauliocola TaxID=216427 RepID=A0A249SNU3_9MOLU|nr:RDD family protein [Mesoplasma chauliocola]ASZ09335.1 RDD family protein [Mesoplasma chauliocola]